MAISLPFFKFYVNDWLTSEAILKMTGAQIGSYVMLLAHQWTQATCTIPADRPTLYKLGKWAGTDDEFAPVLACFSPTKKPKGRLLNKRLYTEWQAARIRSRRLQEGGKQGAKKRWSDPTTVNHHQPLPATPCELGPMPPAIQQLIANSGGGRLQE